MVDGTTTRDVVSQRTEAWAASQMLEHAKPKYVLEMFADTKPFPRNVASSVKFRRKVPLDAITTPLQEGVSPTAQQISYVDVPATLQQYGGFVEFTDRVTEEVEDPVVANASELLGEQMGKTVEQIIYGAIKAGTTVYYANGAARSSVNTPVSIGLQRAVVRGLKNQKADKITRILSGSAAYATMPVEASYVGICHTDVEPNIRDMPGFVPCARYGSRQMISPYEIGTVEEVRYVTSPDLDPWADGGGNYADSGTAMVSTGGSKADVYPILYIGKMAYAVVPLRGRGLTTKGQADSRQGSNAPRTYVLNANVARGGDPLGQRGSVGWKGTMTALITNQTWMARAEVATTADGSL